MVLAQQTRSAVDQTPAERVRQRAAATVHEQQQEQRVVTRDSSVTGMPVPRPVLHPALL
jgi:hypothetical protein